MSWVGVLPEAWPATLPGKPAELQRRVSADGQPFQRGDKVKCLLDIDVLRDMEEGHGGWNPRMAEVSCLPTEPGVPSPPKPSGPPAIVSVTRHSLSDRRAPCTVSPTVGTCVCSSTTRPAGPSTPGLSPRCLGARLSLTHSLL